MWTSYFDSFIFISGIVYTSSFYLVPSSSLSVIFEQSLTSLSPKYKNRFARGRGLKLTINSNFLNVRSQFLIPRKSIVSDKFCSSYLHNRLIEKNHIGFEYWATNSRIYSDLSGNDDEGRVDKVSGSPKHNPGESVPNPAKVKALLKKKSILRTRDGIPLERLSAKRPIKFEKSNIVSGGSRARTVASQGVERRRELSNPNKLRILAGIAKGKKIESPNVYLRPMMAKVRKALFSTLEFLGVFSGNNTSVLDTFSGSGSVGLEALSRGANSAVFVDFSKDCAETCIANAKDCGFSHQAKAICAGVEDVLKYPARFGINRPFQLISITPPYEEVVYNDLIDAVCQSPLVEENTIVIFEYPVELGSLPYIIDDKLYGVRNRRYGRTVLGIYVYRPTRQYDMRPEEFLKL